MRLPEPKLAKLKFPILIALATALLAQPAAWAEFSKVAVGLALPVPQGDNYQLLSRKTALQGEAWYNQEAFGEKLKLHGEFAYQPYDVKNVASTSLNLTAAFVGIAIEGGKGLFGFTPFMNADLGLLYDSLSFTAATSGTTSNSATAFALQLEPGVDIPVWGSLGLMYEMPITDAFFKNNLVIWSSVFALRWTL